MGFFLKTQSVFSLPRLFGPKPYNLNKKYFSFCNSFTGAAIGDCMTDQVSITASGQVGTPIICGTNGGYHSEYSTLTNKMKYWTSGPQIIVSFNCSDRRCI